jgi:hypothetical protein
MESLLLGLIACILLFGPIGLGVFAVIMTCFLPFYIVHCFARIIFGHGRKHRRKDKVVVETQRGKVTLLYQDGRWVIDNQKPRIS